MKSVIIGTAGHIDHGKSSLVKALTGTDPDRLKEEKARGITIDLGFAHLNLEGQIQIGFVDVPGHERFIKNMLAGVGGIDAVLLVVAADESVMPQTQEHFEICKLLGVRAGIIIITKADLVDREFLDLVKTDIKEFARGSFLQDAPILFASVKSGLGLLELERALLQIANETAPRKTKDVFRLPIDRSFTLHGFGTVVTGTLTSGTVRKDEEVEIYPSGLRSRIRGIQVYAQPVDQAYAGQRTAINLQNIEVTQIHRGMQLSVPERFRPCSVFDAKVELLGSSPIPLNKKTRVRFHHGTSELIGAVSPIEVVKIEPGQSGFARIVLESPILAVLGDRFIFRRLSPMVTLGGGTVLDINPPRAKPQITGRLELLKSMETQDWREILLQLARRKGIHGMSESEILSQSLLSKEEVRQHMKTLVDAKAFARLPREPFQVIDAQSLKFLNDRTHHTLEDFHKREPLSPGMSKEQLFSHVYKNSHPDVFKLSLDQLSNENRIAVDQDRVRIQGQSVFLTESELAAKKQIEEAFLRAGLKVPFLEEVLLSLKLPRDQARSLVLLLSKEKKLIKISESLFFHTETINRLKSILVEYKRKKNQIDVGQFKDLTGISRKYAIPLLEYLDRERVTRREGDSRLIL